MTGCERVRAVLSDGKWHTTAELIERTHSTVHSRISDLRKRGDLIEQKRIPGATGAAAYAYRRLLPSTSPQGTAPHPVSSAPWREGAVSAPALSEPEPRERGLSAATGLPSGSENAEVHEGQLTLV